MRTAGGRRKRPRALLESEGITRIVASPLRRAQRDRRTAGRAPRLARSKRSTYGRKPIADRARYRSTETLRAEGGEAWSRFLADPIGYLGGDPTSFRAGVLAALGATVAKEPTSARVAVFTHGLPINIVLSHALGLDSITRFLVGYGSVTRLRRSRRRPLWRRQHQRNRTSQMDSLSPQAEAPARPGKSSGMGWTGHRRPARLEPGLRKPAFARASPRRTSMDASMAARSWDRPYRRRRRPYPPDRFASSLQLLFAAGGLPDQAIDFEVATLQEGKRFSARNVRGVRTEAASSATPASRSQKRWIRRPIPRRRLPTADWTAIPKTVPRLEDVDAPGVRDVERTLEYMFRPHQAIDIARAFR